MRTRHPQFRWAVLAVLLGTSAPFAGDPPTGPEWKYDLVRLTTGAVLKGLILEETPTGMRFQNVRRRPGRPTSLFTTTLESSEIASVDRLGAADREQLRARVKELEQAAPAEKEKIESLELETIDWHGKPKAGHRYVSDHFILESDAAEEHVRLAAVRLEAVYEAYARYLPPRVTGRRPTRIELFQSRAGYEACLKAEKRRFVNVACYDPAANRILCFSDLERLNDAVGRLRKQHQQMRIELDKSEAVLKKLYRGAEQIKVLNDIRATRRKLDVADRQNEEMFDKVTRQLFAVLSHEAFHAYLASFVCVAPRPEPPRWMNEGLAQIFEKAVVEAGELRVGHADRERLGRAKEAIRKGELVPLNRLLRSVPRDFLAAHSSDLAASDAYYLTSWALAFYLTFERHLLGTTFLDRYWQSLANGVDPEEAFVNLVGQPLPEFEAAFHQYLKQLQSDGTSSPVPRTEK